MAYDSTRCSKTDRIERLKKAMFAKLPEIESARAKLVTESYVETEGQPIVIRRALAFKHILENIPIIIRDDELIVGSTTIAPRGCQTYPEFSFEWLEAEFDTVETREADKFHIEKSTANEIREADKYWKGKTTSDLALSYMSSETKKAMEHNFFTTGNYYFNGVGHVTVQYWKVLEIGFEGIMNEVATELENVHAGDANYATKSRLLQAMLISCQAVIDYANRYANRADEMAKKESNPKRAEELRVIVSNCRNVPAKGATSFYEACQSFWFIQQLLQLESSGHSISPGRFDQYMYPYFKADVEKNVIKREFAQELIDCIWIKLNDLNKCRDAESAKGFAGYSLFQNLIVGGQNQDGVDATNDISFMCLDASIHVHLPMPSLSIRVWNGSPHELLIRAAEVTRTGVGLPAYYNDEVIIPSLMNMGATMTDARNYSIIGCVEPQVPGKTWGWHDAAFFNMCRPVEMVFSQGVDAGEQVGVRTKPVEQMKSFDEFYEAYKTQMNYFIELLVNSDNAIDQAHAERMPLPFLSTLIDDCITRGKTPEQGGAIYNFTGPQGFGIANMADGLYAIKELVFKEKKFTLSELKQAMYFNFGEEPEKNVITQIAGTVSSEMIKQGVNPTPQAVQSAVEAVLGSVTAEEKARYREIRQLIESAPKFGNDDEVVDAFARDVAYTYTKPLLNYFNPRGGRFQAGLYPVSANVPLGAQTGATPDGRLAGTPVADGVSPSAGKDVNGPTAAANSVAKLDHGIASNGTLYNMKFHPTALAGEEGLNNFVDLIRSYFDQKGMHMQFNVVSKETLIDAQKHPENYKGLVVRVAGYSALFTTLSKSLQDDIIKRTEMGF